ncbi:MAG: pyrroline-5-carboxylate reductase [Deltaproteobacteria bacterium]|nr:MAG: pyrroline-5-carboxylate reductase [Deltaproteobacteria bacterium]
MARRQTVGCIGTGNMGSAFLTGLVKARLVRGRDILAWDKNRQRLGELQDQLGLRPARDNRAVAAAADVLLLAVKPQILDKVLAEIRGSLKPGCLVLSVAAGYPTALIEQLLDGQVRVVRAMPNIAAQVGQAATAICPGRHARRADVKLARRLFESCGSVLEIEEGLMDAVTGLSGTGPMYVFIIIEALSDAGVRMGLSRRDATALATQTVLGAAHMVQQTGRHPIYLKDLVTSPGGTAINALYSMERTGLRAVLMEAVETATRRSRELGRPVSNANGG